MKCINTVIIHVKCCLYSICLKKYQLWGPSKVRQVVRWDLTRASLCCVYLSVYLSVTSRCFCQNGWTVWSAARRLLSTSLTLCCKEIQVSTKTTVLHSGTFIEFFTLMRSIILDRLSGKPFAHRVHGNSLSQQTPFPTLPFVAVGTCKNKKNMSVLSQ